AILFMAGTMLHLTSKYKLDPVPFIIMLVFACNNGSAMSSVGNPIGVLIALKTGLGFTDFLKWAAPVAIVVDVVTYFICRWWFAAAFASFARAIEEENAEKARRRAEQAALVGAAASTGSTGSGENQSVLSGGYFNPDMATIGDLSAGKSFALAWAVLGG